MTDEPADPPTTHNEVAGNVTGSLFQAGEIGSVIVSPATVLTDRLAAAADRLATEVRAFWRDEQQRRRIHDPRPLRVRWRPAAPTLSDHWENVLQRKGPLEISGDLDQIADVYRRIPSQRLVVLGRTGSGKTVVAVRLVLDLLATRSPNTRVPVMLSLGSWNPMISLEDWLTSHLIRDHPWLAAVRADPRTLAAELVTGGWILPVLDGFDEISPGRRPAALEELSADVPLVLTCRPDEYRAAVAGTRGVHRAAVIELSDLALDDVKDYLRLATPKLAVDTDTAATRWDPVLGQLSPAEDDAAEDSPAGHLAHVLTTPLMVALARTIYSDTPDRNPIMLLDAKRFRTVEDVEYHLLGNLVPSVYRSRRGGRRAAGARSWRPEDAQRWLGTLAAHLDHLHTHDLAWWQLGTGLSRWTRTLVIAVLAGLVFGCVTGVGNIPVDLVATSKGLGFAVARGLVVGTLHGLVAGLAFGLMYWFADQRQALKPEPVRIRLVGGAKRLSERLVTRVKLGSALGLVFIAAVLLTDRFVVAGLGLDDGLGGGLVSVLEFIVEVGLGLGLVLGLMAWLEAPIDIRNAVSPADLLRVNRSNLLIQMLVAAVVFGLEAGLGTAFIASPLRSLETGVVFGLEAGFAGGMGYGLCLTAWGQWVALARIWLPLTRKLPWRLLTFLDDACQRGALRQAGAVYQFRHAQLRDHLTRTQPADRPPGYAVAA